MRQAGYSFRISPDEDGPMSECIMTAPDAQDGADAGAETEITTIWTVAGNDIEKDIESHSDWIDLAETEREHLRDFKNGSKKESEVATTTADGAEFKTLIKAGTTSYTISQIVVQRTMTVNPTYSAGSDSMVNVNRIYSKAGLSSARRPSPNKVTVAIKSLTNGGTPTLGRPCSTGRSSHRPGR